MLVRNRVNFAAGALYVLLGAGFVIGGLDLKFGTPARMGPGFFPIATSVILIGIGLAVIAGALRPHAEQTSLERWDFFRLAMILGSVVLFAAIIPYAGLFVSIAVMVMISSMASDEFSWKSALLNTACLAIFGSVLFIYGLGLQLPFWPPALAG